jgi:tetratricopeptide (TPR) repeat protein
MGGDRPSLGTVQRPQTLPGRLPGGEANNRPGIGGNRPGGAGDRPAIGGNRPGIGDVAGGGGATTLPGKLPGRPGIGGNRPGIGGDRPGIGGNRPGIGDGNIGSGNWGNNNNFNNINVNSPWGVGGGWGYPGVGGGGWANAWNSGYVNPHYGGWYNGCWSGNYGYGGGWWAPFALGAASWGLASTIGNWGLGYGTTALGYGGYVNPYYSAIPAAVASATPYDYSQPVVISNYVTDDGDLTNSVDSQGGVATAEAAPAATAADQVFDEALARFKAGDYAAAVSGCDKAIGMSPKDSVIHEVRALALFALGRYPEAAATLNAVLAVAPGMDWTTLSSLYGSVDGYTAQLRKLEDFCSTNPDSAAGHFVLAYHYLVGGHADRAREALEVVVAKQPGDAVAKRLLEALTPPGETPPPVEGTGGPAAPAAGPETDLVGAWKATAGGDAVLLSITEDSRFTWKAMPSGKPAVELAGTISTARDAISLESEQAGTMAGKVASKGPDAFDFTLAGAPAGAKPLAFTRQK